MAATCTPGMRAARFSAWIFAMRPAPITPKRRYSFCVIMLFLKVIWVATHYFDGTSILLIDPIYRAQRCDCHRSEIYDPSHAAASTFDSTPTFHIHAYACCDQDRSSLS